MIRLPRQSAAVARARRRRGRAVLGAATAAILTAIVGVATAGPAAAAPAVPAAPAAAAHLAAPDLPAAPGCSFLDLGCHVQSLINPACLTPPTPGLPGTGWSGAATRRPSPLPASGNPFGPHATTTEYDQYGYAGLTWSDYDIGCLSPVPAIATTFGNLFLGMARVVLAFDNALHNWSVNSEWLSVLNPVVTTGERVMYQDLFAVWAGIALLVLALTVLWRARRADLAGTTAAVGWALFVLALVGVCYAYPLAPGRFTSRALASTIGAMDAGFVGQSPRTAQDALNAHASLMVSAVLYPGWAQGEFGDASSPTARTYGPQLFVNQALTWRQAAGTPQQIAATEKAEQARWQQAAARVKAANPVVYPYLQGSQGLERFGTGFETLLAALIVAGFDILCSLVVIVAMLAVLFTVVFLPALAVVGIHHDMRHLIIGLLSRVFSLLVSAVLWAAAAGLDAKAAQILLTNNLVLNPLPFVLLALLPIVLFILIRKVQGNRIVPRPVAAGLGLVGAYAWLRHGTAAGVAAGIRNTYNQEYNPSWHLHMHGGWPGPGGGWSGGQIPPNSLPPPQPPPLPGGG